jgi:hypothetical protein
MDKVDFTIISALLVAILVVVVPTSFEVRAIKERLDKLEKK